MPKRKTKPTASGASTTASSSLMIRKPTPDKSVKSILLTKVQTESLMIDEVFSSLSTIEWSNVSRLVEESPSIYQNMLSSHDVYRNILASLSSLRRTTKNNTLGTYCLKCCRYLKQKHIESLFHKTFASKHTDMEEDQIIKIIQFTLTDFAGKCNRSQIFEPKHERTFWIDKIIPIFQSIGDQTGLVGFEWCEKIRSRSLRQQPT